MVRLMKYAGLAAVLVLVVAVVVGCGRSVGPEPVTPPKPADEQPNPPSPEPTTEAGRVKVYFARGERIGVAGREVASAQDTASLAVAAVNELVKGPTAEEQEFGLGTLLPEGIAVNNVDLSGGVATVDLSKEFEAGGGSLSMQMRVAQVVFTLTQFDDVESVAFKIDGSPVEAIGGEGVMVAPSVDRGDFEDMAPAILVESPVPGQRVSSPLTISGSSNTFEATHQLNVTDPDGLIIAEKTVTATSGTGTRGTWSETVELPTLKRSGLGAIIVFEYSAKDGSQINVVEIPVRMEK